MAVLSLSKTVRGAVLVALSVGLGAGPNWAYANELEVPILEYGGDGQVAECTLDVVVGLKNGKDGYLAVRTGPAESYREIDALQNDDFVITFDVRGDWAGVYYGRGHELIVNGNEIGCGYVGEGQRPVPYPGKKGWVLRKWLELVAG